MNELHPRDQALSRALAEVERTRAIMQTVLDNMIDGVSLFDKDFRWQFSNRKLLAFQQFAPELERPGTSAAEML